MKVTGIVLTDKLGIKRVDLGEKGFIKVYEKMDEVALISKTLFENGVIPTELFIKEVNLEKYYMDLVGEISENCGVTNNQIRQWIREERLTFGDDSPIGIDCEGCGAIIKSGRFCPKCKTDLTRGLLDATRKEEPAEDYSIKKTQTAKMRFLEK